ncbi:hypothetical protein Tco_1325081 [Tanacetum coccineum]
MRKSDWDDDERSGGKILVIQERLAQNQQEFLDEYLPQWDENLAIQKKESESEWENPFAAKRGENHTILHLSKEEENDDLPYPKFRNFKQVAAQIIKKHEEHAFPSSSSQIESTQSYQPPHDSIMGPPVYPPTQQNPQPFYKPDYQFGYPQGKSKIFNGGYGEYYNSQWTLPPAWTESGVMLILPADPGLWSEVISRWESITINRLNNQTWSDNKTKIAEMVESVGSWKPDKELPVKSKEYKHEWNENTVTNYTICYFCGILTTDMSRLNCPKCQLTTCALCARNYLGKTVNFKRKQPQKQQEEKDFNSNEVELLKELLKEKTKQVQLMIRNQAKEYYENKAAMQKKEEIWQSKESLLTKESRNMASARNFYLVLKLKN